MQVADDLATEALATVAGHGIAHLLTGDKCVAIFRGIGIVSEDAKNQRAFGVGFSTGASLPDLKFSA
ncbi:hypothetical protein BH09CHL1_BH09CHL1_16510 [soil metagenome]